VNLTRKWAIEESRRMVLAALGEHDAEVWLFGSCARGEVAQHSDIDIAILPKEELPSWFFVELGQDPNLAAHMYRGEIGAEIEARLADDASRPRRAAPHRICCVADPRRSAIARPRSMIFRRAPTSLSSRRQAPDPVPRRPARSAPVQPHPDPPPHAGKGMEGAQAIWAFRKADMRSQAKLAQATSYAALRSLAKACAVS
jgi:predicted nucleotidyltransferase